MRLKLNERTIFLKYIFMLCTRGRGRCPYKAGHTHPWQPV